MSLKVVPFESREEASDWSVVREAIFYSNCGRICSRLWDIQCQRMAWPWKPGYESFKV